MRTAAEIIKYRYTFYDEDNAQKDIELCGEQVQELMKQYAKEALQEAANMIISDGNPLSAKDKILALIEELK